VALPLAKPDDRVKGFLEKRKSGRKRRSHFNPRREMSFLEHLDELRGRLIICAVSILFTTIVGGIFFAHPAVNLLTRPFMLATQIPKDVSVLTLRIEPDGTVRATNAADLATTHTFSDKAIRIELGENKSIQVGAGVTGLIATTLFASVLLIIKAAIILGIVFAMPIWLHQLWLFVAPALTVAERKAVRPVLLSGIFLFPLGVVSAYGLLYLIMPVLLNYARMLKDVQLLPDVQKYVSFELNLMLAFGIVFETPLILVMVVRMGLISTDLLRKSRSYVVVFIFALAAILTPTTDPFTMVAMALPMIILFEISLFIARRVERKVQAAERESEASG
jgi:sec-independent protein translocase protein TatC